MHAVVCSGCKVGSCRSLVAEAALEVHEPSPERKRGEEIVDKAVRICAAVLHAYELILRSSLQRLQSEMAILNNQDRGLRSILYERSVPVSTLNACVRSQAQDRGPVYAELARRHPHFHVDYRWSDTTHH